LTIFDKTTYIEQYFFEDKNLHAVFKGTFLSGDTDVFVISPNRQTLHFPELENLDFGD